MTLTNFSISAARLKELKKPQEHPDWNSKDCLEKDTIFKEIKESKSKILDVEAEEFNKMYTKLEKLVSEAEKGREKWEYDYEDY